MRRLQLPPVHVFLIMAVIAEMATMTFSTMSAVYRITEAGLNPLQLILVGTVLELTVLLADVPTGVLADVYSRRLSMIVGYVLVGIGYIMEGSLPIFASILLAQVVWGFGYTFVSGAFQAWLSDELKDDSRTAAVFVKATKYESFGALAGICLSAALATVYVGFSLIAGGLIFIGLGVFVAVSMSETGFTPKSNTERSTLRSMKDVLTTGLRAVSMSRVLMALVAIEIFFGMSSEPFDRLWAKHTLEVFEFPSLFGLDPIVWFGVIQGVAAISAIIAISTIERIIPVDRPWAPRVALSIFNAVMIGVTLTFALTGTFGIAIAMVVVVYVLHRVTWPFAAAWINRNCESEYRATVFSLHEQANSFGQVFFGPGMGLLATVRGIRTALIGVSILLVPPQLLYLVKESSGDDE